MNENKQPVNSNNINNDLAFAMLKTLQDNLEHERQRSQQRGNGLTTVFVVFLLIVVAGLVAFIALNGRIPSIQLPQAQTNIAVPPSPATTATEIDDKMLEEKIAEEVERRIRERSASNGELEARLDAEREKANRELEERLAAERAKIAAEAEAKNAAANESLKSLNEAVESMRKDNEALRKDNDNLRATAEAAKNSAAIAIAQLQKPNTQQTASPPDNISNSSIAPAQVNVATPPIAKVGTFAPQITVKRPPPPKGYSHETISIPATQSGDTKIGDIPWNLILPTETPAP